MICETYHAPVGKQVQRLAIFFDFKHTIACIIDRLLSLHLSSAKYNDKVYKCQISIEISLKIIINLNMKYKRIS